MNLDEYTDEELLQSLLAETAKALSETRTVQSDLDKINSRLRFTVLVTNILKDRKED